MQLKLSCIDVISNLYRLTFFIFLWTIYRYLFHNKKVKKKTLKEMGFTNVANAEGGFDSLKKAGLPIVNKEKK